VKVGDNVFVYGTLKAGHGANSFLQGRSEFVRADRVSGQIMSCGGFPGYRRVVEGEPVPWVSEGPTVVGEVYRINDEKLPEMLDRYEGYPSLYGRIQIETESGETAWVYEYNGEFREDRLVPSGNWQ
jgi:gamma-glutamylcyclotransferase (GGCT)/AIG2-like uncharacterized protein YtfP